MSNNLIYFGGRDSGTTVKKKYAAVLLERCGMKWVRVKMPEGPLMRHFTSNVMLAPLEKKMAYSAKVHTGLSPLPEQKIGLLMNSQSLK